MNWTVRRLTNLKGTIVNTNRRTSKPRLVSLQSVAEAETEPVNSNVIEENSFGKLMKGTFTITVKSTTEKGEDGKPKVLYSEDNEPFKYQTVDNLPSLFRYLGEVEGEFPDANIKALANALTAKDNPELDEKLGKAVDAILKMANAKFKSDAKSSAYQSIVNKYTPLEGQKRDTAIARTIANFVKLASITPEVAIEVLKSKGAVPADYTVQDYKDTPLRRTKDEEDGE
jgi:hypothetical protein